MAFINKHRARTLACAMSWVGILLVIGGPDGFHGTVGVRLRQLVRRTWSGWFQRGVAVWFCIIGVEVLHGTARTMFLAPAVGDFRARQIAVLTGSVLILLVATAFIRWIRPPDAFDALWVGLAWLVLTVAFEIAFGRYAVHASWSRIASDYNVTEGGLLPIGLLVLTVAPLVAAKVRHVL